VRELLRAGRRRVKDVWMVAGADPAPILTEIEELAYRGRVPVRSVARGQFEREAHTEAPQGVLAHSAPVPEADLDELVAASGPGLPPPFLLGLDGVTDPHNVGTLLRTALGAGATGALLPRHRAAHLTASVTKAAAGAIEHLPIAVVPGLPGAILGLREHGIWVVGLDAGASDSLFDLAVADGPVCLLVGAEGAGLARLTRQRCDVLVSIPQAGPLDSLNVAAAGALACFEVARRRHRRERAPGPDGPSPR
jgi:23S rRNA (guanosine2251-2'-O)-methyltransferase